MATTPVIGQFSGADVQPWLEDVARLRIEVFRHWPYLYQGDAAYEREYLEAYARSPHSVFVLALDGGGVVGASTGLPLADDEAAFSEPFRAAGMAVDQVFYFGESVLLPEYRGRGTGHAFFDRREAHAQALGRFRWTAFCAVDRDAEDPRKPPEYRPNDAFWTGRGYARQPGMTMRLPWNEAGRGEIGHALTFWLRDWRGGVR